MRAPPDRARRARRRPAANGAGIVNIDQDCAESTGCGPADTPGFPVTTAAGQSYRLTGDLTVTTAFITAVSLAPDTTLDLNGFRISGPASCSGTPATCTGTGTGAGTGAGIDGGAGARVFNGTVRGMGGRGVVLRNLMTVENLLVVGNGADGLAGQCRDCRIVGNRISTNALHGIDVAFVAGQNVLVQGNTISANGGDGIRAGEQGLVLHNGGFSNGTLGLRASLGAGGTGFGHNVFNANNGGTAMPQTSGGVEIAPKVCNFNTTCP